MAQYMLFLRGGEVTDGERTPEESEQIRSPYAAWAGKLHREGKLVSAEEVDGQHVTLRRPNGHVVTDGPFPETRETIGGYFLIKVEDEKEALEIAAACPILERGGQVDLHKIIEG